LHLFVLRKQLIYLGGGVNSLYEVDLGLSEGCKREVLVESS